MADRLVVLHIDSQEFGGAEQSLINLGRALVQQPGWQPLVTYRTTPGTSMLVRAAERAGIETLGLPPAERALVGDVAELALALRRIGPAVFHAHLPWPDASRRALIAARIAGIPALVATCHLCGPVEPPLRRSLLRHTPVDRYVAVSMAVRDGLVGLGIDPRRISVIPNGIDLTATRPTVPDASGRPGVDVDTVAGRRPKRRPERRPVVVTAGRLTDQKAQRVLVEAVAELPGVELRIAGIGPLRDDLERLVAALGVGDRIRLLGFVEDVPTLLEQADVFALTSVNEGLPLVVLEAMAAGVPVVASRVGGIPEAVADGATGILVDPGDVSGTRDAIRRLIGDPDLAARLAQAARTRAEERFSLAAMVEDTMRVYEDVLGGRREHDRARAPSAARHATTSDHGPEAGPRTIESDAEARRNVRLRRADWRFLLPDPTPATGVSFAAGSLHRAAAVVAGRLLAPALPSTAADLVVLSDPTPDALRAAYDELRPGGVCYGEWRRLRPTGSRGVVTRLGNAGFVDARLYWPWPRLAAARAWLPLDSRAAIDTWIATRAPRSGAIARALQRAGWRVARLALATGFVAPIVTVARRPVGHGSVPALDAPSGNDPLVPWGLLVDGAAPRSGFLLIAGGSRTTNKVVGMTFEPDGGPRPHGVVKLSRTREAADGIRREAASLRLVETRRPSVRGVPRVGACEERNGIVALSESPLVGQALSSRLTVKTFAGRAEAVTDWLISLANGDQPADRGAARDVGPRMTALLSSFEGNFESVIDPAARRDCASRIASLPALPSVMEQRDMGPWNLVLTPEGLGVLDWESAEPDGLPVLDLAYFLAYAAFHVLGAMESGRYEEAYRSVRDPRTPVGGIARACLERYCDAVGVGASAVSALHLVTWMVHADSEMRRLVADAGGRPSIPALRGAIMQRLWTEELAVGAAQ